MTTAVYKLTNKHMKTYDSTEWALGEWKETDGTGDLCGKGWLHCYTHPLLAVLFNPIHGALDNPRLFQAEADGKNKDDSGIKQGYTKMRLVKEIPIPRITLEQRIKFGILCAKRVYGEKEWNAWADNWLNGTDRSGAAVTARATADADACAAADRAANACVAADRAEAACAIAFAFAAGHAARAAAFAASRAAASGLLDLVSIAEGACS